MDPMVAVLVPGRCGLKHSHLQNKLASSASLWTDNSGHSQISSQLEYQQMVPYPGTSEPVRTKAAWSRCVSCPVISTQGGYGHGDLIKHRQITYTPTQTEVTLLGARWRSGRTCTPFSTHPSWNLLFGLSG